MPQSEGLGTPVSDAFHDGGSPAAAPGDARLDAAAARRWVDRWDAQQQVYMPSREERFTALIDAVEAGAGRPDPLVLDLGCGPGSLAARLLARIPGATVVAIDSDPVLLALGRAAYSGLTGLRFADADLRSPGWPGLLALPRAADAAVSSTALHWLPAPALRVMYAELSAALRPGGLFLNGDHLREDATAAPTLARLGAALTQREEERGAEASAGAEDWKGWWRAATADPLLAAPAAERERRRLSEDHHGEESLRLAEHVAGLTAAGFTEIGTLWQHGESRVLCAVLGSGG